MPKIVETEMRHFMLFQKPHKLICDLRWIQLYYFFVTFHQLLYDKIRKFDVSGNSMYLSPA